MNHTPSARVITVFDNYFFKLFLIFLIISKLEAEQKLQSRKNT